MNYAAHLKKHTEDFMIIDCRVRPAYKSYLKTKVPFNIDGADKLAAKLHLELPPCLVSGNPDYEAMLAEMDEAGDHGYHVGQL